MLRKLAWPLFFFIFATYCWAKPASPIEQITNFASDIKVARDSSLEINETIAVYADQRKIARALVRRLPTNYIDSYGIRHKTTYRIKQILVNNAPAVFSTKIVDNSYIIYIGDPNSLLAPGKYIFSIQYRVNNATNFLTNQDELFWNITGHSWDFPINKVQATITLPEGANFIKYSGYSGKVGLPGNDLSITLPAPNQIVFVTTKALLPKHGFAVSIAWPKGFIHPPTHVQQLAIKVRESNMDLLLFFGSLILLLGYLLLRPRIFKKNS
jgi:hypothetical protein